MPDGIADVTTKLNVVFVCFVFLGGGRVVGGGVGREGEGQRGWGGGGGGEGRQQAT